ncbi:hypothetical protein DH2020_015043 [Rehmannia glutinosa]|uniref:BolA-like protein n=1 Tax=Rehmannia glutinosa TaxID=99300 RepID=A0ABR0WY68_REHGL
MAVTKEQVESTLNSKLNPSHLVISPFPSHVYAGDCLIFFFSEVIDTSGGCGASFAIEIVSEQFEGKRLLERHRIVNAALVEEMKQIHALSITKAFTPDQWKQQQAQESQPTA